MKLPFKQRFTLEFFTVLAFLFAPILLVLALIGPLVAFVWNQIWGALNFPHDLRMEILRRWGYLGGNEPEPNKEEGDIGLN